jgi:thiamine biosynthesis lipoprotein
MATDFEVLLPHDAPAVQVEAAVAALDALEALEQQLTVYSPTSELSLLNRRAAAGAVRLSVELNEVLRVADRVWQWTSGAYDPTAGPLVEAWGFTRRSGRRPSDDAIAEARRLVGWQHVDFDPERRLLGFKQPGMGLNLGGIGKGYALDRIATRLRAAGAENFLVHGGNSSVLARGDDAVASESSPEVEQAPSVAGGSRQNATAQDAARERVEGPDDAAAMPGGRPRPGWRIGLAHPLRSGHRLGGLRLRDAALGTSGSGKQYFHHRGKRLGHVLDPRSGFPVDHFLSLSVRTARAAEADALATGLFVAGPEALARFAQAHPEVAVVIAQRGSRAGEAAVSRWNLSEADARELVAPADREFKSRR